METTVSGSEGETDRTQVGAVGTAGAADDLLFVLGSSRRVRLHEVEAALGDLWRLTGEEAVARGQPGVVRVREINLMIVAEDEAMAGRVSNVAAHLAKRHPGRVIVLLDERGRGGDQVREAWVSAACYLNREGGRNVCWEQVTIPATGAATEHLVTTAIPFLVPDVNVSVWWPAAADVGSRTYHDLEELADKVILDSAGFQRAGDGLAAMARALASSDRTATLADLTWSRLTPWREMVAGLFDDPSQRALLGEAERLTLVYGEEDAYADREPGQRRPAVARALLMLGWLATRLGWTPAESGWEADDAGPRLHLYRSGGAPGLDVSLVDQAFLHCGFGGLHGVSFEIGPPAPGGYGISVLRAADTCVCAARVRRGGVETVSRSLELQPEADDELLCEEIDVRGADQVYEESLGFAARLAALPGAELLEPPPQTG
jgi:glucose-6-phosphate dehydrogenase assembly protein OpcA